jgi:hypothetical protein
VLQTPSLALTSPFLQSSSPFPKTPMARKKDSKCKNKNRGDKSERPPTLSLEDFGDSELSDERTPPSSPSSPSYVCTDNSMGLSAGEKAYLRDIKRAGLNDSDESEEEEGADGTMAAKVVAKMLQDFGVSVCMLTPLWCDSTCAISNSHDPVNHELTKNIDVDAHYTRAQL